MKTLYLHIGMPKTATSSLQAYMKNNQDLLGSFGFSYRISPFVYTGKSARRNAYFLNGPASGTVLDEEQEKEYQKRLNGGLSFFHEQFRDLDNVIATDEHLWYSLQYSQWDPLQILLDDGAENGYTLKVIVYLRRQDGYLMSNWNQNVKKRGLNETFCEYRDRILSRYPLLVHYDQTLDKIASKIGKENLIVRRFQSDSWVGGNVYTDFLDALGLDPALPLEVPKQWVNTSLPYNFTELKRQINSNHFLTDEEKNSLFDTLKKTAEDSGDNHNLSPLTAEETEALLEEFLKGNDKVAKEYINDGKALFDKTIKNTEKWRPDNPYFLDDANRFLSECTEEDRRLYITSMIFEQQKNLSGMKERLGKLEKKCERLEKENRKQAYTLDRLRALRHPIRTFLKNK